MPKENRLSRITTSIKEGNTISTIRVPSYTILNQTVFYEAVVSNKVLRWNKFLRFDSLHLLHQTLQEVMNELIASGSQPSLPPFPKKKTKLFSNHLDENFIDDRRVLIENYLQKVLADEYFRHSEILTSYLIPSENEYIRVRKDKKNDNKSDENKKDDKNDNKNNDTNDDEKTKEFKIIKIRIPTKQLQNEIVMFDITVDYQSNHDTNNNNNHNNNNNNNSNDNNDNKNNLSSKTISKRFSEICVFHNDFETNVMLHSRDDAKKIPPLPQKYSKIVADHLNDLFIEERRVLLQRYFRRLIRYPPFQTNSVVLEFFGI